MLNVHAQEDSLYISIFVSPLEDVLIQDQDSVMLIEDAVHLDGIEDYSYEFYVAGYDTLTAHSFIASFTATDGTVVSQNFVLQELIDNPDVEVYEDSAILPLGIMPYIEIYDFEVQIFDSNGSLLIALSDFYNNEEE